MRLTAQVIMTEGNEIDAEMTGIQASHLETEPLGDEAMGDHDGQVQHEIDTLPVPAQGNPQKDPDSLFIPEDDPIPPSNVHQQPPPVDRIPSTNVPAPASTPAPAVLKSRSTISGAKMLERIRDREQKLKEKKLIAAQNGPGRLGPNNRTELFCRDEDKEKDRKATEEYHKKKRYYDQLRKKNGGNLGFADEIALIKIEKAEEERKRKRDRDNAKAQEGNSEDLSMHAGFNLRQNPEEELSNLDLAQPSTRKNVSIQDAELQSIRVAIEAANDIPRKKDKDKGPEVKGKAKASGRGKGKRANEAPKKVTKSSRRSKKKQMQLDNTAKQVSSLLCSDVFSQQAGVNAADEPFFKSKTKQQALKDIIASVPVESEKKAKGDMAVLLEASRQFGRGAVKPDAISSKQWSVRGMKTSLKAYQVLGAGFMRQRENASEEPRGGLLADQMGLGKTLMTLGK
jgi:SNF2 family DNA or RNA helicase